MTTTKTRKPRRTSAPKGAATAIKVDDLVADTAARLISMMENGEAGTWLQPWVNTTTGASLLNPVNVVTKGRYTGFNPIRLAIASEDAGYTSNLWATYKQWQSVGAQVRAHEHGTTCVRWVTIVKRDEEQTGDKPKSFTYPKTFTLFAAEQVDGYEIPAPLEAAWDSTDNVEAFFELQGATIVDGDGRAFYSSTYDWIGMPEKASFAEGTDYYATLAHEFTHWTGHKSRCDRQLANRFGTEAYAVEELIAELGSATLCAHLGLSLTPRPDHAAYLASWVSVLRDDPKAILKITGDAGRAVEHLIGAEPQEDDE